MWSEWFDHDTPCNSGGDTEKHTDHWQRLQETETGPLRICRLNDIVLETQYEGGSEITRVSADDAKKGTALGSDGTKFKQMIEVFSLLSEREHYKKIKLSISAQ